MSVAPDGSEFGPIGDEVIFENELVRVWSLSLQPGERQRWHRHYHKYLVIPITDGANEMIFLSGRTVQTNEKSGQALFREPGEPHELLNTSEFQYRNVLVEIK
ncbi:hypothetical protein N185_32355 [Sinorhizobium sp. GW3]|nr:hypothetical protein N185_32355 [Sinorhizobium sp. GW3]